MDWLITKNEGLEGKSEHQNDLTLKLLQAEAFTESLDFSLPVMSIFSYSFKSLESKTKH